MIIPFCERFVPFPACSLKDLSFRLNILSVGTYIRLNLLAVGIHTVSGKKTSERSGRPFRSFAAGNKSAYICFRIIITQCVNKINTKTREPRLPCEKLYGKSVTDGKRLPVFIDQSRLVRRYAFQHKLKKNIIIEYFGDFKQVSENNNIGEAFE